MTKRILALLAPVFAAGTSGCLIIDDRDPPPSDPFGDIAFTWSFDGIADCDDAAVDEVDVAIFQEGQLVEEHKAVPCVGGGLVFTEFLAGRYEVDIDAYSRESELLFAGGFSIRVEGGVENDAGVVVLERLGDAPPPPPEEVGSVELFWSFLYPATNAIESCQVAGVVDIDVLLEGPGGQDVTRRFDCATAAGGIFDNLDVGSWTVHVDAYGRYHNDDIHLFGDTLDVVVEDGRITEMGTLDLPRDEASFADVSAAWSFASATCASAGLTDLTLSIQRNGLSAEDVTTVQCSSVEAVRQTFVPGSYTVRLSGIGSVDDYAGQVTADVAPDTVTQVNIQLAPN
ncbi:MAG: hypothetical protein Q8O67_15225 [Deltaproteobacteria bacterium]|nr:hypothetical protein [Deltaproteobacteria bacterium]